ncbi:MAG: pyruvate kinase [Halovenus sp.]
MGRAAKIVCTLGPASGEEQTIRRLADAGMSVARFNASHGNREHRSALVDRVRSVERSTDRPIATVLDLPGPKIRTGEVTDPIDLEDGTTVESMEGETASSSATPPDSPASSTHTTG